MLFRKRVQFLLPLLLLLLLLWGGKQARSDAPAAGQRTRAAAAPEAPAISLIDSPSPTCYRVTGEANACLVNWASLEVAAASAQSVVSMTLAIDGDVRANYQGYFQSEMRITSAFHGDGFRVACGQAGVDGVGGMGRVYQWTAKAAESGGNETSNIGSVVCPAGCTTTPAAVTLTATPAPTSGDLLLEWTDAPTAVAYDVYSSTAPYTTTPAPVATVQPPATTYTYTVANVLGDDVSTFYLVRARNACGTGTAAARRVGEFAFSLVPGT